MSTKYDGGTAFPAPALADLDGRIVIRESRGMSLRDWFAGKSLQSACDEYVRGIPEWRLKAMFGGRTGLTAEEIIARLAHDMADAMLEARKK